MLRFKLHVYWFLLRRATLLGWQCCCIMYVELVHIVFDYLLSQIQHLITSRATNQRSVYINCSRGPFPCRVGWLCVDWWWETVTVNRVPACRAGVFYFWSCSLNPVIINLPPAPAWMISSLGLPIRRPDDFKYIVTQV